MRSKCILLAVIFITLIFSNASAGSVEDKDSISLFSEKKSIDKSRVHFLNYTAAGLYGISMTWLYSQWYKDYPKSSFHFFNDNSEWEQVDKYAHAWDAYNIAKPLMHCYRWAGVSERNATLYGAGIAFLFQSTVEVFDGFNSQWGFSGGDMLANLGGTLLFAGQQLGWKEQRIVLKFSFHQSKYAQYRPQLLGTNLPENILKDYNGLTQWVSVNPHSFFKQCKFPKWLSIAWGYGAEGMTGGKNNPVFAEGKSIPSFDRYSQYYLSVDIDLSRVETKHQFLNSIFKLINIIHLPSPAIEWSGGRKPVYHLLYF